MWSVHVLVSLYPLRSSPLLSLSPLPFSSCSCSCSSFPSSSWQKPKGLKTPRPAPKGRGPSSTFSLSLLALLALLALLLPCFCPASARLGSPDEKDEAEGRQGHSRARRGEARRCYDGCTRTRTRTAGYKRLLAAAVWPGEELRSESRLLQWVRAWMWKRWLWAL